MKRLDKIAYKSFNKFLLRTPLLPFDAIISFSKELKGELNQAILQDREISSSRLKEIFNNPILQEALFLASPDLFDELTKWLNNELKERKEIERLQHSLLRYFMRMASRPTPFGLFSGCSIGEIADHTDILLLPTEKYQRHTRLDMYYLCNLAQDLTKYPQIRYRIKYYPNTSIYVCGTQVRYVEYRFSNKQRTHHLVSIDDSEYLQKILNKAAEGAYLNELAHLIQDEEINSEEALTFIEELVDNQILVSELEPTVTGKEFIEQITDTLLPLASDNEFPREVLNILVKINKKINIADASLGNKIELYQEITRELEKLKTPFEANRLFQTDMIKPVVTCKVEGQIIEDIKRGIEFLSKLTIKPRKTNLHQFIEAFSERYEDMEVLLTEALDMETGIGYQQGGDVNPLIDDMVFPSGRTAYEITWNRKASFLLNKYIESIKNGQYEMELTDKDLEKYKMDLSDLPDTLAVMASIVENTIDGNGKQQYRIYLNSASGPTAACLLGRFCHADKEIHDFTRSITDKENEINPDVIYAEIAHLPESRTGNILLRPILREYEIPYLAMSAVKKEFQININDLLISERNGQIILRSKSLNKIIIPRLTNAHNYSYNSLPIYNFLCDLQTQNQRSYVGWDWDFLQREVTFLPRIIYRNLVFSLATWNLRKSEYEHLLNLPDEKLLLAMQEMRKKYQFPRYILVADGDNELTVDLNNILCIKMLIDMLKKRQSIVLTELLLNPQNSCVTDEEGNFTHQFIFAFHKEKEKFSDNKTMLSSSVNLNGIGFPNIQRKFIAGDNWLYYKLYAGVKTTETILTQAILPLCDQLIQKNIVDKWFFIRYTDPKEHIRLRLHHSNENTIHHAIPAVKEYIRKYLEKNLIWKVQIDTYQQEIERYGMNTMELAETLFYYDSAAIARILSQFQGDESEQIRWQIALKSLDTLLSDFQMEIQGKLELLTTLRDSFAKEFNMGKALKLQLDNKFRNHRSSINNILNSSVETNPEWTIFKNIINERSALNQPVAQRIISLTTKEKLSDLLGSFIHMNLNRLFKSKQRMNELVIYDFLQRYYTSEIAKAKKLNVLPT